MTVLFPSHHHHRCKSAAIPLVLSLALTLAPAVPASARPHGVQGWTTGSMTFIRVRPGALVPPVAKVPRATRLFVWGTFDGWYRVETPDHIFGWVYHDYIHAPGGERLAEMSHQAASQACRKDEQQRLYGPAPLLASYYQRYHAASAMRALQAQGLGVPHPVLVSEAAPPRRANPVTVEKPAEPSTSSAQPSAPSAQPSSPSMAAAQPGLAVLPGRTGNAIPGTELPSAIDLMQARQKYLQDKTHQDPGSRTALGTATSLHGPHGESMAVYGTASTSEAAPPPSAPERKTSVRRTSVAKPAPALYRGGSPRDIARRYASSSFGQSLANQAMAYRGYPYVHGANSPGRGFDCSGLVYYLLRRRGYSPPRTSEEFAHYGQAVSRGNLKAGDILLFANTYRHGISHVGVYLGNGRFVHAATAREGVRVDSLNGGYYARKFYGARRVASR